MLSFKCGSLFATSFLIADVWKEYYYQSLWQGTITLELNHLAEMNKFTDPLEEPRLKATFTFVVFTRESRNQWFSAILSCILHACRREMGCIVVFDASHGIADARKN